MVFLKSRATFRPVSYTRRSTFTVVRSPVVVLVFRICLTTVPSVSNRIPSAGDLGKEATLNGVEFRAIARVVGYTNLDTKVVDEVL